VNDAGAYGRAIDVMSACIDGGEDIDDVLNRLDEYDWVGNRQVLHGFVNLCASLLFDLEELTQAPTREILQDHARRRI
jgi:hypothetical protein